MVKVGGFLFFRESSSYQGDSQGKDNPTHYRELRFYAKVRLSFNQM